MNTLFKSIRKLLKQAKISKKKKTAIFIGNTKKKFANSFRFSGVTEGQRYLFMSVLLNSVKTAKIISRFIDGKFDLILIDVEKKVESKNKMDLINIERIFRENINKSFLLPYKGNDITAEAGITMINNLVKNHYNGLGGKKILILGFGNIGFKIAQKLVESGAIIFCYRRNYIKSKLLCKAINIIKPLGNESKVFAVKNYLKTLSQVDLIVNCSDQKGIVNCEKEKMINDKTLILDIGKGIFTKNGFIQALKNQRKIYRLDVSPVYNSYLENVFYTYSKYNPKKLIRNK